jgi:hypothetical protein
MVKALQVHGGEMAISWNGNAKLINEVGFSKPLPGLNKTANTEVRTTYCEITNNEVKEAISNQSMKKAAEPDKIGCKIIRLLRSWEEERIVALVRASVKLGHCYT